MQKCHAEMGINMRQKFIETLNKLLQAGYFLQAKEFFETYSPRIKPDYELFIIKNIFEIFSEEVNAGIAPVFTVCNNWHELVTHYTNIKFMLRRIEYDIDDSIEAELRSYIEEYKVSKYFIDKVINCSILNREKVEGFMG